MNPQTSGSTVSSDSLSLHCVHRTASGRRCRMAVAESVSGLCSKHATLHQKDLDQADLTASLIGDAEEFRSAVIINRSLGELYKLQARNKIHPRRAAVMAYTCNLLLRTLPAIKRELHPQLEDQPQIIIDLPRPSGTGPLQSPKSSPASRVQLPCRRSHRHDHFHTSSSSGRWL